MPKPHPTLVAKNDLLEVYQGDRFQNEERVIMVHGKLAADSIASFAFQIIERFAMVAAQPDGEDSAGRSKLELLPTDKVAIRAFDIAEAAYAEAEKRGHLLRFPSLYEDQSETV